MRLRPAGRNVLVKPLSEGEIMYAGKVHLPDTAKQKPCDGVVMQIGIWCQQVKPGDHVIYSRKQTHDVEIDEEDYVLIDERGIAVVLEEEKE